MLKLCTFLLKNSGEESTRNLGSDKVIEISSTGFHHNDFLIFVSSKSVCFFPQHLINFFVAVFDNDTLNYVIFNNTDNFIYVDLIRIGLLIATLGTMTSIIRERIGATLMLKNYEKRVSTLFLVISFIVSQVIPGIGCTYALYIGRYTEPGKPILAHSMGTIS